MFEEEISPEELFRQFFGGGMGGGPFGGGPFGGFGAYNTSDNMFSKADDMDRRQRFRFQHERRRTRSQDTPDGRRRTTKTAAQPCQPGASISARCSTIIAALAATLHRPSALFPFLWISPDLPFSTLRQSPSATNPPPRLL